MDEATLRAAALDYHRVADARQDLGRRHQGPHQPARSLARLLAGRRLCLPRDRGGPAGGGQPHRRANLVAVITNGTAVLGLGNIGPLASKPVMEGKGCLFKKFAGIDVFDIEIDATDPDRIVDVVAALEPTFGGINLEDIKAPECFIVERRLRERMKIPVFHDDQHGTAIIVSAAILNGLELVGKNIAEVKVAVSRRRRRGARLPRSAGRRSACGARTSSSATSRAWSTRAASRRWTPRRRATPATPRARTLADIVPGADVFLGLSAGGVLKPEMIAGMARDPLILALANPEPEISPELAQQVRPDAILCTGRSDYPNQVNNVLCFPFIFRGALDVGATDINEAMKIAAVHAIAELARAEALRHRRQRLRRAVRSRSAPTT